MNSIRFTKMHGAGNDYIYINAITTCPPHLESLAVQISDRHKGVGSDGLIAILPSQIADFKMRIFNANGSEGEMCGNAARCIGKYVYDKGLCRNKVITLETLAGVKTITRNIVDNNVESITVDMGEPSYSFKDVTTPDGKLSITAVSMGNPHGVLFVSNLSYIDVKEMGRMLESNPIFPDGANIEFASVMCDDEIEMRVWERGSGETLSCGTGACAVLVAGVINGKCGRDVLLHLLGGDLRVKWDESNNHVYLTGDAVTVFDGEYILQSQ
ncbi:MAG: diaminopimelate epimerase [Muribaculaceae bacterium]